MINTNTVLLLQYVFYFTLVLGLSVSNSILMVEEIFILMVALQTEHRYVSSSKMSAICLIKHTQIIATYVFQRPGSVPDLLTCIRPEAARETKTKKFYRAAVQRLSESLW